MARLGALVDRTVIGATLVLVTAGGVAGQQADATTVELTVGDNMRFVPAEIRAHPGQRLHVVVRNTGKIAALGHNFVVLKKGISPKRFTDDNGPSTRDTGTITAKAKDEVVTVSPLVKAGQTGETTFDAPSKPGEYAFLCSFPGHYNLGMRGQLLVK